MMMHSMHGDHGRPAVLVLVTLFTVLLAAPRPGSAQSDGDEADGEELYQQYCSVCHGERGDGESRARFGLNPPPADFTAAGLKERMSADDMIQVVTHGKPGTAMAAWGSRLSDEEIEEVVEFVRSEFVRSAASDAGGSTGEDAEETGRAGDLRGMLATPFPDGVTGNFQTGRALYMLSCVACHGRSGTGDGPRADFIVPKPRDLSRGPLMDRMDLYKGIRDGVRGREMPAWGKVMTRQQLADVAEYVFVRFQRPRIRAELE